MLVLTRRKQETIVLPDLGVSLKVISIKGNQVKLGVTAPDSIKILRGELAEFCHPPTYEQAPAFQLRIAN